MSYLRFNYFFPFSWNDRNGKDIHIHYVKNVKRIVCILSFPLSIMEQIDLQYTLASIPSSFERERTLNITSKKTNIQKWLNNIFSSQAAAESDPCHQRKCTANEHCCDGTVCVDTTNGGTCVYKSLKEVHLKVRLLSIVS